MKLQLELNHVDARGAVVSLKGFDGKDGISGTFHLKLKEPVSLEMPELAAFHEVIVNQDRELSKLRAQNEQRST